RPVPGLTSPSSRRRRKTSVERIALAHAPCGVCVKLSSMKQKGPRSNAREGRCCTKLSTRCSIPMGLLSFAYLRHHTARPSIVRYDVGVTGLEVGNEPGLLTGIVEAAHLLRRPCGNEAFGLLE